MRHLPGDVDRLMWLVAENRDPRAIADFESRFPELKAELAKRMTMVSKLKTAGRAAARRDIPRFVPRYAPVKQVNRGLYIAVAFAVSAVALGSYALYSSNRPLGEPPVQAVVEPGPPVVRQDTFEGAPKQLPTPDMAPPRPSDIAPSLAETDRFSRPINLKIDRTPVQAAIMMVCKNAGLECEIAPGLSQEEVEPLEYAGEPASVVLSDLGSRYGFTAFPQEHGHVLIIPARPTDSAPASESAPLDQRRPTGTASAERVGKGDGH